MATNWSNRKNNLKTNAYALEDLQAIYDTLAGITGSDYFGQMRFSASWTEPGPASGGEVGEMRWFSGSDTGTLYLKTGTGVGSWVAFTGSNSV